MVGLNPTLLVVALNIKYINGLIFLNVKKLTDFQTGFKHFKSTEQL